MHAMQFPQSDQSAAVCVSECRLRACLQMLGENVLGATIEFSKALKEQENGRLPVWDKGGSVYFDLFGRKMVRPLAWIVAEVP